MNTICRTLKLYLLIIGKNNRVSVRQAQFEIGLSRRTVYRYIKEMGKTTKIRIEDGVILLETLPVDPDNALETT